MSFEKENRCIVFISDSNYLDWTLFAIQRVRSYLPDAPIFLIYDGLDFNNNWLEKNCTIITTNSNLYNKLHRSRHVTKSTYLKLFLGELIPTSYEKALYLDSDTLIFEGIKKLYNYDISNSIGAIVDRESRRLARKIGLKHSYFNAGVLLFNLDFCRTNSFRTQRDELLLQEYFYQDQDILNLLYEQRFTALPEVYNWQVSINSAIVDKDIVIYHFIGPLKPWIASFSQSHELWAKEYEKLSSTIKDTSVRNASMIRRSGTMGLYQSRLARKISRFIPLGVRRRVIPLFLNTRSAPAVIKTDLQNEYLTLRTQLRNVIELIAEESGEPFISWAPEVLQSQLENAKVLSSRKSIISRLPKSSIGIEVGTQRGDFAKVISELVSPSELHLVDVDVSQINPSNIQDIKNVVVHEGYSDSILRTFPDRYFDWIYIDASHSYEYFTKDLEISSMKVKIGGLIICNDYTVWSPAEVEPYGILKGVHEFLQRNEKCYVKYIGLHGQGYHDIAIGFN
jgi:lipopolysaccharide biosynthesis glycosyltransferase